MDWDVSTVPDPQDPATFAASKLDWSERSEPPHAELLDLTTRLLEVRRTYPEFTDPRFDAGTAQSDNEGGWLLLERGSMTLAVNFANRPTTVPGIDGELSPVIVLGEVETAGTEVRLGPYSALAAQTPQPPR